MSIVALKKKTLAKYNNNSVGLAQFSLNGTHRNQGYIGQTSLSRSLPRTLARGNTLRGSGGCCGKYNKGTSVLSSVTSTEDNSVVKSSVLSYDGMSAIKYRWIRRPAPITVVKSDNNNNNTSAQDYIKKVSTTTVNNINTCSQDIVKSKIICHEKCKALPTNVGGSLYNNKGTTITKPQNKFTSLSYGQYLLNLNKKCIDSYTYSKTNVNSNNPPKSTQRTPFPIY